VVEEQSAFMRCDTSISQIKIASQNGVKANPQYPVAMAAKPSSNPADENGLFTARLVGRMN